MNEEGSASIHQETSPVLVSQPLHAVDQNARLEAVLQAIHALEQLAAMETEQYKSTLRGPYGALLLQQSLDQLGQQFHFEQDTDIPALARSIHRLQSNVALLVNETDQQANEINTLQATINKLVNEKRRIEQALRKIQEQYQKVVEKLKRKKKEKKSLVRHVKDYVKLVSDAEIHQKQLEESNVMYKLHAHEQVMAQNRNRTTSTDSNFSDADALDFPHDDNLSVSSSMSSSASSLVTDEGIATLRISPSAVQPAEIPHPASLIPSPEYTLTFRHGAKVGLKIRGIPVEELPKPPKGVLTSALLDSTSQSSDISASERKESGFSLNLNFLGKKTPPNNSSSDSKSSLVGYAFVVSGYNDDEFDRTLNAKPTIGARIIAVNETKVEETWSRNKLLDILHSLSDQRENDGAFFTITFRNDPLTAHQRESLQPPPCTTPIEDGSERSGKESTGEKNAFQFGFLKLGQSNSKRRTESEESVEQIVIPNLVKTSPNESPPLEQSEEILPKTGKQEVSPANSEKNTFQFNFLKMGQGSQPKKRCESEDSFDSPRPNAPEWSNGSEETSFFTPSARQKPPSNPFSFFKTPDSDKIHNEPKTSTVLVTGEIPVTGSDALSGGFNFFWTPSVQKNGDLPLITEDMQEDVGEEETDTEKSPVIKTEANNDAGKASIGGVAKYLTNPFQH